MKTKCEIVQALLDEKRITAEEAVVLLMGEKEYIYINQPYPVIQPSHPLNPYAPFWYSDPFPNFSGPAVTTCDVTLN